MKFLTLLGQILVKGTQIAMGVSQLLPANQKIIGEKIGARLAELAQIVITIEAAGQVINVPGADKLRMATPLVAQALLQSDLFVDQLNGDKRRKVNDQVLFQKGAASIASGLADVLNSIKTEEIKPEDIN